MAGFLGGLFGGGGGGGGGGLLSGLGGKVHDFMSGTTPELAVAQAPELRDERLGAVQQVPQFANTGATTGGLLSKLSNPDARGLTLGDKLFASGSILQGDSGGAATYLQNQRANAAAMDQQMEARRNALQGARAFRNNVGPNGDMNFQGYVNDLGDQLDPAKVVAMRKALRPDYQPVSTAGGGIASFNPETGAVTPGIAGAPQLFNPDGSVNEGFIRGKGAEALAVAKAQREGKPLAPRVGRAGGKRASYGQDEVDWGAR